MAIILKDPALWLLIGIAFGFFLRWVQEYAAELRRIRKEAERIERENNEALIRLLAIAALYVMHRKRPDLFPNNPLDQVKRWPPS
jgi:hypothetical protein